MGVLEGRVAIITGASLDESGGIGIGGATAQLMAREGARVVAADVNGAGARRLAESIQKSGGQALGLEVDVSRESDIAVMVAAAVDEFGGLDILHNNAGALNPDVLGKDGDLLSLDVTAWERTLAVNLTGAMLGCKHAIPHMLKRGRGAIVNTSSVASLQGDLVRAAYGSSKGGLNALTRYVATMYGKQGIRCNAVAPGVVLTSTIRSLFPARVQEMMLRHHLTPYLGEPEHVAQVVVFLASDAAAFMTGETLRVDGGYTAHAPSTEDLRDLLAALAQQGTPPKG
ncbi:SDR family oxidoreductase [Archangium sp.]|uniref:SDR family NAD(P)-dependent oxidoreductase n=1 Tax=Archangium sp. TaxID=1872627 RepID=UPI00286ADDEE|nr:SDR family oxidoreductase [Archangium sp.]